MIDQEPWTFEYLEDKFSNPDPWRYFKSPYEQERYKRQLDILKDRKLDPRHILELGSAEGAQTLMLAEHFPFAMITGVEVSSKAIKRAEEKLTPYGDRIKLVNADLIDYEPRLKEDFYDVCIWSEPIYYVGARLNLVETYELLKRVVRKLAAGGLLIIANTVDLHVDIPESIVTRRPLIDC